MPRQFDPIFNDDDRADQIYWDDQRDLISREPGGTRYVPEERDTSIPTGGTVGPYTPPTSIREQWRSIYARMSMDELYEEENALYDELMRLSDLSYLDEFGHGMNDMKRELIKERMTALRKGS